MKRVNSAKEMVTQAEKSRGIDTSPMIGSANRVLTMAHMAYQPEFPRWDWQFGSSTEDMAKSKKDCGFLFLLLLMACDNEHNPHLHHRIHVGLF